MPDIATRFNEPNGELNAARDNAILVTHGASQGRNGYKIFIGPGKAFDTSKYFVATVDAIGGGGSSKPADGIVTAGMIYFPWLYSDEHLNTLMSNDQYQKSQRAFGTAWAKVWDARSLIYRYQATANHDVSQPFGGDMADALGQIKARTLIMPGMTDRTLPTYMAREIYRGVKNSIYVEIPSYLGHIACCPSSEDTAEYVFVSGQIKRFLAELSR